MPKLMDDCPAFHGGPEFGNRVLYCIRGARHEGNHQDELGNEWERHDVPA